MGEALEWRSAQGEAGDATQARAHVFTDFRELLAWRTLAREIWDHLPIWFFTFEAIGVLHFLVSNVPRAEFEQIGIPICAFAWTTAFPLFWVLLYQTLRVRRSERLAAFGARRYAIPLAIAIAPFAIYVAYAIAPFLRNELELATLTHFFELMQLFWIAAFMVHVAAERGASRFATFFGVAWLYGLVLENGGIVMGYFFEPGYRFYLGGLPAPFATMMGWCLVFYACIEIASRLRERLPFPLAAPGSALLTTALALSLDLQLDPLASLSGVFWRWNDALPNGFLSVPFVNYLAWFCAFLPFSFAYFTIFDRSDLGEWSKVGRLLVSIPNVCVVAAILFFGSAAIVEGGFDGPTFRILREFFAKLAPYA
ncbi:hypothetical protein MYXO_00072 [Myxococcaceae bacterium]|jgi:hypothetical protein|nr:hypothetical protein MYXO_00072 [Myxococcaceae bacterium]